MPLKHHDPFSSSIERLDTKINPYVALLKQGTETGALPVLFGPGLKDAAGSWRQRIAQFHGRDHAPERLVVEIGCHKGQTLLEMARTHPDTAFVGLDITYKRVVTTAQRAVAAGLTNVYCAMANAVGLDMLFAPGEIDGVVIFFPDPWVKKKSQAKNRLVDDGFCRRLESVLSPRGFCWFKTDQRPYFDGTSAFLAGAGFTSLESDGLFTRDFSSVFEQRFQEQKLPTYGAKWLRSSAPRGALAPQ